MVSSEPTTLRWRRAGGDRLNRVVHLCRRSWRARRETGGQSWLVARCKANRRCVGDQGKVVGKSNTCLDRNAPAKVRSQVLGRYNRYARPFQPQCTTPGCITTRHLSSPGCTRPRRRCRRPRARAPAEPAPAARARSSTTLSRRRQRRRPQHHQLRRQRRRRCRWSHRPRCCPRRARRRLSAKQSRRAPALRVQRVRLQTPLTEACALRPPAHRRQVAGPVPAAPRPCTTATGSTAAEPPAARGRGPQGGGMMTRLPTPPQAPARAIRAKAASPSS